MPFICPLTDRKCIDAYTGADGYDIDCAYAADNCPFRKYKKIEDIVKDLYCKKCNKCKNMEFLTIAGKCPYERLIDWLYGLKYQYPWQYE